MRKRLGNPIRGIVWSKARSYGIQRPFSYGDMVSRTFRRKVRGVVWSWWGVRGVVDQFLKRKV